MLRICVWMDAPSHYQGAFFKALDERDDVDLLVCYMKGVSPHRVAQGWNSGHEYMPYELCFNGEEDSDKVLSQVSEWPKRIHVISYQISRRLVDYFCANDVQWCYWSEMPGVRLAGLLGYRMLLFRLLNPLVLACKRRDGRKIEKHALVAFGQGVLAEQAFRTMGIPRGKTADLYYAPEALEPMAPSVPAEAFSKGRRVFLSVGALCRRKGVDVLLKAFSRIDTQDWCLVFCGLDKSDGEYQILAKRLGIMDRVLFMGAYPVEKISELYAASDVFILPSRFDGWGVVLNEAASLGLPVIGTDLCGASWHVIQENSNGYRVRAGSVKSLQQAMQYFVEHPDAIGRFGAASKKLFLREFTPLRNAKRLVDALLERIR